jgi:o-succinylbenzoate---CoA ligase
MERRELAALLGAVRSASTGKSSIVESANAGEFIRMFSEAVAGGGNIFVSTPAWGPVERAALATLAEGKGTGDRGWLMIPSGGAGGGLKFARHDSGTLSAAVNGYCSFFELGPVNSVCVLPLHHVSGLMAWMRSALTGGMFIPWPWKDAEAGRFPAEVPPECCISLVPTQLQRLLSTADGVAWLRGFEVISVGGGPAWEGLLEAAARLELPLSPCYGATETAAMVAALKPWQFLGGQRGCGAALPHAKIETIGGIVRVTGDSVFRGYFPEMKTSRSWNSGDLGSVGPDGSLSIIGRADDIIITGGEKVAPSEVEAALRASGEFDDVAIIGIPDPEWGQLVVACHPIGKRKPNADKIAEALSSLEAHKRPKEFVAISPWPRSPQGKINRRELSDLALGLLHPRQ